MASPWARHIHHCHSHRKKALQARSSPSLVASRAFPNHYYYIAPTLIIATTVGNLPDGGQLRFPSLHLRLLFSSDINCTENLIPILVIPQQCILIFGFTIVCCQTRQWHIHIVWILFPVRELFRTHPPIFLGHSPSFYFG